MKLLKRLIAVISSLAMMATMTVAVTVNAATVDANKRPIIKLAIADSATEAAKDLSVLFDVTKCEKGQKVVTAQMNITLPNDIFDTSDTLYSYTETDEETGEDVIVRPNMFTFGAFKTATYKHVNDHLNVAKGAGSLVSVTTADKVVITFKGIKIKDGVKTEDVKIKIDDAILAVGTTSTNYIGYKYSEGNVDLSGAEVTYPGNKTSEPTATPTAEPTATPTATPVAVAATAVTANGGGNIFVGQNGNLSSVASVVETTLEKAVSKIRWKINVTPVAGKSYSGPAFRDFNVNVDGGDLKVGLIVAFDENDIQNVEIIGIEY